MRLGHGLAKDFKEGVEKARESVRSGAARSVMERFKAETGGED